MSDEQYDALAMLEEIQRRGRQEARADERSAEERRADERRNESDRLARAEHRQSPEGKAEHAARVQTSKVLRQVAGSLRFGVTYSDKDRAAMVSDVEDALGGDVSSATRAKVAAFVEDACTAMLNGGRPAAMRTVADALDGIAGSGDVSPAEHGGVEDPRTLAAMIPR